MASTARRARRERKLPVQQLAILGTYATNLNLPSGC